MGTLTPPERLGRKMDGGAVPFLAPGRNYALRRSSAARGFTMEKSNGLSLEVVRRTERQGEMKKVHRPLFKNTTKDSRRKIVENTAEKDESGSRL